MTGHPRIEVAALQAIAESGTGVHGVRILAGTLPVHRALEARIASFHGAEDAIIFSSGYVANLATISALVGPGDFVFSDVLNHASIHDGCRISGATVVPVVHNSPADLARKLKCTKGPGNRLVVVEAVYSMDGDIAELPEMIEMAKAHGAFIMIDEAHSLGVIGPSGKVIMENFGLPMRPSLLKMGTFSKAIPSIGGYVAADAKTVRLLRHRARGYIFSSALPAPCAAAALAAFDLIEQEPWRVQALQRNAGMFRSLLAERGVDTMRSQTAVVPALCGDSGRAIRASLKCMAEGVYALPVTFPAVQAHLARLRLIPLATHADEDLRTAADVVAAAILGTRDPSVDPLSRDAVT